MDPLSGTLKKEARHGSRRAGLWPVQLRFETGLTSKEYVSRQAWQDATLACCPLHPHGGCSFTRHVYVPLETRGYLPLFRSGTRITPS